MKTNKLLFAALTTSMGIFSFGVQQFNPTAGGVGLMWFGMLTLLMIVVVIFTFNNDGFRK